MAYTQKVGQRTELTATTKANRLNRLYDNNKIEVDSFVNRNIIVRSAVTAHDLSAVTHDTTVIYTGTMANAITLPQATTANLGLVIKILFGAPAATTAFKLGFADTGSTTLIGNLTTSLNAGGSAKEATTFEVTSGAKSLEIDSNDETAAGGDNGSRYVFTYYGVNTVWVDALGLISGTTASAPDAAASTTTGTS